MTLLERIRAADPAELAHFLCKLREACAGCPAEGSCYFGHTGMTDFIEQEVRDDLEISYLVE